VADAGSRPALAANYLKLVGDYKMTNKELLNEARSIAITVARLHGTVTADDIAERISQPLGPVAGSIFRDPRFEFTGGRVRSRQARNHSRELKIWQLA
jgi:hypothetical protein